MNSSRNGVYSYEYMDSWEKFEDNHLPPIEAFYSKIDLSEIIESDCNHAQKVWKEFGMKTLGDYHDLYLKMDVLLLSNVFEAFRTTCLEHYALYLAHFYTSPRLAWQACLKNTGVNLEHLTDLDILLMFEQGTWGGITQAFHRYARENNKYMSEWFDPGKESHYLQFLDANNLYYWAMSQSLQTGEFKWVSNPDELRGNISELVKDSEKGYLLEVDVLYSKNLHDLHNDLLLMW